jgi:S-adenosylmethionine-diacylgycerolhomoserine-N-methlytransferase
MTMILQDLRILLSMLRGTGAAASHAERMGRLYRGQADGYDAFRERFLLGRDELVGLLDLSPGSTVVELGGGTGRNLERFGGRLETFARAYVVDLSAPLLEVARERCRRFGWRNVEVVEADATTWRPPGGGPVDAVCFSYSLTMIPDWFRAVDNALAMLRPGGLLGAVDFTVSRKRPPAGRPTEAPAGRPRHGALARALWPWWFAHDDVFLSPDHLPYLEARTERVHLAERQGRIPYLPFLRPPYLVYVGRKSGGAEP